MASAPPPLLDIVPGSPLLYCQWNQFEIQYFCECVFLPLKKCLIADSQYI